MYCLFDGHRFADACRRGDAKQFSMKRAAINLSGDGILPTS
jgi:hypothetical protein